jgi:hypothetical protein
MNDLNTEMYKKIVAELEVVKQFCPLVGQILENMIWDYNDRMSVKMSEPEAPKMKVFYHAEFER